jgi:hypothetical protein
MLGVLVEVGVAVWVTVGLYTGVFVHVTVNVGVVEKVGVYVNVGVEVLVIVFVAELVYVMVHEYAGLAVGEKGDDTAEVGVNDGVDAVAWGLGVRVSEGVPNMTCVGEFTADGSTGWRSLLQAGSTNTAAVIMAGINIFLMTPSLDFLKFFIYRHFQPGPFKSRRSFGWKSHVKKEGVARGV